MRSGFSWPLACSSRRSSREARAIGHFVAPVHQRLAALARNLWWSWDDESVSLFRDLDPVLWPACNHNPD